MKRLPILVLTLCVILIVFLIAWLVAPASAQFNGCSGFCGTSSSAVVDGPGFNNRQGSGGGSTLACIYTPVTTGTQNVAYTGATPSASGGVPAYTFSETGSLPTGLSINTSTGVISGTPSVSGTFTGIQVKVADTVPTTVNCGASFTLVISAPAFQGPGDIVSNWFAWYGLRAFDVADMGNALINVCDPSNVTCADWKSSATTGNLVATTNPLNGTDCTVSTSCTIKIFYDRSGANSCTGSVACNLTQATAATRATLTFNCHNSLPCAVFSGTQGYQSSTIITAPAQPFTVSVVAERTGNFTSFNFYTAGGSSVGFGFNQTANTIIAYGSNTATLGSVADSALHSILTLVNGATSNFFVDGTSHTENLGTGAFSASGTGIFYLGQDSFGAGRLMTGDIDEMGVNTTGLSGGNLTAVCHNQFGYWATTTSC